MRNRRRSLAPRATNTGTEAGTVSMLSAGIGAPVATYRRRLPPVRGALPAAQDDLQNGECLWNGSASANTIASLAAALVGEMHTFTQVVAQMRAVPVGRHEESLLAAREPRSNSTTFANISIGRRPAPSLT